MENALQSRVSAGLGHYEILERFILVGYILLGPGIDKKSVLCGLYPTWEKSEMP